MENKKLLGTIIAVLILLGIGLLIGYLTSFIDTLPTQVDTAEDILQGNSYNNLTVYITDIVSNA